MTDSSISAKRCSKCKLEYPATPEYFARSAKEKSGLRSECKTCQHELSRAYGIAHVEEMREKGRRYRTVCADKARAAQQRYRATHTEQKRVAIQRWRSEHRERFRANERRWRNEHPEQVRENQRNWNALNPERRNAKEQRRRARKRGLPDTFTGTQALNALMYWHDVCAYCGKPLTQLSMFEEVKTHMDHFIPLSDPRSDNPGTVVTNMLPTCARCNQSKSKLDPVVWITRTFGTRKAKKILAAIEAYFKKVTV